MKLASLEPSDDVGGKGRSRRREGPRSSTDEGGQEEGERSKGEEGGEEDDSEGGWVLTPSSKVFVVRGFFFVDGEGYIGGRGSLSSSEKIHLEGDECGWGGT